jgi:ribosomal protein S12 methylthiotransferase
MDVLDVMAKRKNMCNYLDIPLQHGSTRMLELMRRGTTREKTEALLNVIREKIPQIAIRTTLIVGHPGETEEAFMEMMDFVEKNRFERLGVFTYSHEEDTHSYTMKDDVPEEVKQQRLEAIMELQEGISEEINAEKVGKKYRVLIDRLEGGQYVGRTEHDSPEVDNEVLINSDDCYLRVGDFCEVEITSASAFDLFAKPIKE